jgi:hypothetical protein
MQVLVWEINHGELSYSFIFIIKIMEWKLPHTFENSRSEVANMHTIRKLGEGQPTCSLPKLLNP